MKFFCKISLGIYIYDKKQVSKRILGKKIVINLYSEVLTFSIFILIVFCFILGYKSKD